MLRPFKVKKNLQEKTSLYCCNTVGSVFCNSVTFQILQCYLQIGLQVFINLFHC